MAEMNENDCAAKYLPLRKNAKHIVQRPKPVTLCALAGDFAARVVGVVAGCFVGADGGPGI